MKGSFTRELDMPHMIRDAKRVSKCEECQRIREKQLRKLHNFDYAVVKNSQQRAEVKILVGAGPRGETFARAVHPKGAKFEDLELFLKVLQTRCGNTPVYFDQEECLREVVHSTAGRLGMPTRVTAVEQGQANGGAEQRVRALTERLQIMVENARRRGAEIILDHPVAQWAVTHARWIQNFLVKSDVDLSGGGTIKITPHDAHTGAKHRAMFVDSWNEFLSETKSTMTKHPKFLVGWSLGHKDADVITLMEDGNVSYNGSWK